MKILFFPRYDQNGSSSRYRIYQYIDYFERESIECKVSPLLEKKYNEKQKFVKYIYVIIYYIKRIYHIFYSFRYDLIYIEKELFPYFPPLFEFILFKSKVKVIFDYDDATFIDYKNSKYYFIRIIFKNKIDYILKNSSSIVTGSPFLSKYCTIFNKNVVEIPTSLSASKYKMHKNKNNNSDLFIIGWIGSKSTSPNLLNIIEPLERFHQMHPFKLNLVGFDLRLSYRFKNLNVEFIEWNEETEIEEIYKFDVGIMPLDDIPFNHGKCGFKLIQYMACSKPTISSPMETNIVINRNNLNLHSNNSDDWFRNILTVYSNLPYYQYVGMENRFIFEKYYSIEKNYPIYIKLFNKIINE